jgi:hypothetical protein
LCRFFFFTLHFFRNLVVHCTTLIQTDCNESSDESSNSGKTPCMCRCEISNNSKLILFSCRYFVSASCYGFLLRPFVLAISKLIPGWWNKDPICPISTPCSARIDPLNNRAKEALAINRQTGSRLLETRAI